MDAGRLAGNLPSGGDEGDAFERCVRHQRARGERLYGEWWGRINQGWHASVWLQQVVDFVQAGITGRETDGGIRSMSKQWIPSNDENCSWKTGKVWSHRRT